MFLYIVLTPISTTSGLWSTGNTRKYHQIDVYIYQCGLVWSSLEFYSPLFVVKECIDIRGKLSYFFIFGIVLGGFIPVVHLEYFEDLVPQIHRCLKF